METRVSRTFKAFQYRDFRLMWIGACTSSIGTWMQIVAQGWLIYRLSHSRVSAGARPVSRRHSDLSVLPDRRRDGRPHRAPPNSARLAVRADGQRRDCSPSWWPPNWSSVWQILCLSLVSGFAQAFGGPAYQALIPTLVDREDMPNAIALNSIQFNVRA